MLSYKEQSEKTQLDYLKYYKRQYIYLRAGSVICAMAITHSIIQYICPDIWKFDKEIKGSTNV